jgi:hypothetical protein
VYVQLKIPAWVYLGIWIGFQVVMAFFSNAIEFAWFSHIGGFVFGLAVTPWVLRWRRKEVAAGPVPLGRGDLRPVHVLDRGGALGAEREHAAAAARGRRGVHVEPSVHPVPRGRGGARI